MSQMKLLKKPAKMGRLLGLFVMVFLFSVIWHFPVSGLLSQTGTQNWLPKALQIKLPAGILLHNTQGVWWKGQTELQWQNLDAGKLTWQWQPFSLLQGQIGLTLDWRQQQQFVQVELATNGRSVAISDLMGDIKLNYLGGLIPSLGILSSAEGSVILKQVAAEGVLAEAWPKALSGKIAVSQLSLMGVSADYLEWNPEMHNQKIKLPVQGGGKGWKLSGESVLKAPNQYQNNLVLKADNASALPDWVPLMMRQTSSNQAVLKTQGRW